MFVKRTLSRPTAPLFISIFALVVALGGTAYASGVLPRHSVGTVQLKKNAVVSGKVKDGSLLRADFRAGQLPAGPKGDKGDTGPAGSALGWATILGDGSIYVFGGQLGAPSVTHPATGIYCIKGNGWEGQGVPYSLTKIDSDPGGWMTLNPEFFGSACNPVYPAITVYSMNSSGVLTDAYAFTIAKLA